MSSNNGKTSTVKALITLITISLTAVGSVIIPLGIFLDNKIDRMRQEDIKRVDSQFAKSEAAIKSLEQAFLDRAMRISSMEKSIEMIIQTRREHWEEFQKRFDKIDASLIRLEAKIKP